MCAHNQLFFANQNQKMHPLFSFSSKHILWYHRGGGYHQQPFQLVCFFTSCSFFFLKTFLWLMRPQRFKLKTSILLILDVFLLSFIFFSLWCNVWFSIKRGVRIINTCDNTEKIYLVVKPPITVINICIAYSRSFWFFFFFLL